MIREKDSGNPIRWAAVAAIFISALAVSAVLSAENYLDLQIQEVTADGVARLSYRCDTGTYNFSGAPLSIYLAAVRNPAVVEGPASLEELFSGGAVYVFEQGLKGVYHAGAVVRPSTIPEVSFPPVSSEGLIHVDMGRFGLCEDSYALAAVFLRRDTGGYVSAGDRPFAVSGAFTPFSNRIAMLDRTLHVGDSYDPYMAGWEVPNPMGTTVEEIFEIQQMPSARVVLKGSYFGTYDSNNPIYINRRFIGFIPGLRNANSWGGGSTLIPPSFFRQGENVITFRSARRPDTGHPDDYMVKGWELFYN